MRCANPYNVKVEPTNMSDVAMHNHMMAATSKLNQIFTDVVKGYGLSPKPIMFEPRDINKPIRERGVIYVNPKTVHLEASERKIYNLIYAYLIK